MKKISIAIVAAVSLLSLGACKKKGGGMMGQMKEFKDKMCTCKDKACVDKVNEEMTKWSTENASKNKDEKPSEEDMKEGAAIGQEMAKCMQKAMGAGDMGGGGDMKGGDKPKDGDKPAEGDKGGDKGGGGAAATGVKECDDVVAAYEKLFKCDKFTGMPAEAQDAQKKGLETMKSAWHFDNDAAKDAAKPGCKAALDGLQQSAKAMGCEI
jgi:hypothetical protein